MHLLVCNAGSTSLKFKLYQMPEERVLSEGRIERVGDPNGGLFLYKNAINGTQTREEVHVTPDYEAGIRDYLARLTTGEQAVLANVDELAAVGFKTVLSKGHYGVHVLDEEVMHGMEEYLTVAPAHNKHYLQAVRTFQKILPNTPMVGAFETAFHQTMPKEAYIYSMPYEWYERYGIRRLGYHGASHAYIADCLNERFEHYRAVSCHLGGSCSLCAIIDGKSVDTSFGFSLQTGLPQMSRSGDIDPYIIFHLVQAEGMTLEEVKEGLQMRGGMLGISGLSNDLRDLEEAAEHHPRAQLAIDIFCRELVRYIGGYAAMMGGLDCIAFTGGIGENSESVRSYVLEHLAFMGIERSGEPVQPGHICSLTTPASRIQALVIPANEELGIARKVAAMLREA